MLVAMLSPRSAVAMRVASTNSACPSPTPLADGAPERLVRELEIRLARELTSHLLMRVHHHAGDTQAGRVHGLLAGAHDEIAAQDRVRPTGAEAHGLDILGVGGDLQMAPHRTALLGQARHVQPAESLSLQVRGHAHDRADGHHTGAAHARDHDAVRLVQRRQLAAQEQPQTSVSVLSPAGASSALAQAPAVHGHKARTEALHAGVVLVARRLIDGALAAELGLQRQHRHAVGLHAAVAAALAHQIIDDDALGRIGIEVALAPTALLCGTGLIVDDDRGPLDLAHLALHAVIVVPVIDLHTCGEAGVRTVLLRFVRDHDTFFRTLGQHLGRDLRHGEIAVQMLTAGHRHGVVV